jgi:hypothetical protein
MKKSYLFNILLVGGLLSMAFSMASQLPQGTNDANALTQVTLAPFSPPQGPTQAPDASTPAPLPPTQAPAPTQEPNAPTQTPGSENPTAIPGGQTGQNALLAKDDFSQDNGLWGKNSDSTFSIGYSNGEFLFTNLKSGILLWSGYGANMDLSNSLISVDAGVLKGTSGYFGLLCRFQDGNNYYAFLVSDDGQYSIQKNVNKTWTNLVNWTSSSDIPTGKAILFRCLVMEIN